MRKLRLVVVLCAALSLIGAASATAASVTTSPGGATTASATSTAMLGIGTTGTVVTMGGGGGGSGTACGLTMTLGGTSGTSFPLPIAPATAVLSPLDSTRGTVNFMCGCSIRSFACTMACDGLANLAVTSATSGGVTAMRITGFRCTITVPAISGCRVNVGNTTGTAPGGMNASYSNSSRLLSILTTGQNLTATGTTCASTLPNGTITLAGPLGLSWDFSVSPTQTITAV
jgi:hypothetical protein